MQFGVRKFFRFLPVGVLTASLWCAVNTLSVVIAGRAIGEKAVAALNLVCPLLHGLAFFLQLIATGTAVLYSLEMGKLNRQRADERFSQGLWTVLAVGIIAGLLIRFGGKAFLSFYGATPEVVSEASSYLRYFAFSPLVGGLMLLLQSMLSAEGDVRRCLISFASFFAVLLASLLLGMRFGLGACALALVLAELAATLVLATHFFSEANTLRLVRVFRWSDIREIMTCSFGDASASLCIALLQLFATKFVILTFGSSKLIALQVATLIIGFCDVLDGFGTATQPLFTVYHSEGNFPCLKRVLNASIIASLTLASTLIVLLETFPSVVPTMLGLTDPATVAECVHVTRLTATVLLPILFIGIFNSYYMCVERTLLAVLISFSAYLVFPIAALACGAQLSLDWFWLGFTLGPILGLAFFSLFLISMKGVANYPYLFSRAKERRIHSFTLPLTEEAVVEASRRVGESLKFDPALAMRVSLLVEETLLIVREKNPGRKVLAEVTLDSRSGRTLTLRDDGVIFDLTDADAKISSLRGFVVASLMERQLGRVNLITTGFNRNVFRLTR